MLYIAEKSKQTGKKKKKKKARAINLDIENQRTVNKQKTKHVPVSEMGDEAPRRKGKVQGPRQEKNRESLTHS